MLLPAARGPITAALIDALRRDDPQLLASVPSGDPSPDPLGDEDLQLALWVCYELHYRGFADVAARWEWEPDLIRTRAGFEAQLLDALRRDVAAAGRRRRRRRPAPRPRGR